MNIKLTFAGLVAAAMLILPNSGVLAATVGFTDVGSTHPNYTAIMNLQARGIINGYPDGSFKPDELVKRVEALKIILLGAKITVAENSGTGGFKDTIASEWYAKYLLKAKELGIVAGYPDGTFKPTQAVNLVENLKMLINALKIDVSNVSLTGNLFADTGSDQWYAKFVAHAKLHMWLMSENNMANPSQGMTRGKLAQLLYNALKDLEATQTPAPSPSPSSSLSPTASPSGNPIAPPGTVLPPADLNISIESFAFNKQTMTIALGTKVRWTNKDAVTHTVTSDNGKFSSPNIEPGKTFDFSFNEIGTFSYHCTPHPTMIGTITVKPAIQVPTI